jgi:carbamoyltransferase
MTAILGISAFYHDSAAALVVDGEIVAAAQEERFSRRKHDHQFPAHAVEFCLAQAGLTPEQLDYVGFYEKTLAKFDRLLETYLAFAPRGFRSFSMAMPLWFSRKVDARQQIRQALNGRYRKRIVFVEHHESHAASAFFPSPYQTAAILTMDGVGEWATTTFGRGDGNRIELSHELRFPHSLGLLYSAFTYFCGFKVNSGEYKLMGLAPYGEPRYADRIRKNLLDLKSDGSFRLNMRYFNYCHGLTMTNRAFADLFDGPPRAMEAPLTQREMDLAASIQQVTEEIVLRCARHVQQQTGRRQLCLAGGVALNCVANGRILREGVFDDVWVQPAASDAGGALGAALFIWHQLLGRPRPVAATDSQKGSLLGPHYRDTEIRAALDALGAVYEIVEDEDRLSDTVAGLLAGQKVVGWFQGRMEYGPRALGARSILADPRNAAMQSTVNLKIKYRESFRPFAPAVLAERASEFFAIRPGQESPYMLLTMPVSEHQRLPVSENERELTGLDRLKVARSTVPAVTHVDYSARIQTVDAGRHPRFHRLLRRFADRTGCPVLLNTSFNRRGEPIVCTPEEAYRCFMATGMDVLVLERFILHKNAQPAMAVGEHIALD